MKPVPRSLTIWAGQVFFTGKSEEAPTIVFGTGFRELLPVYLPMVRLWNEAGWNVVLPALPGHEIGNRRLTYSIRSGVDLAAKTIHRVNALFDIDPRLQGGGILVGGFSTGGSLVIILYDFWRRHRPEQAKRVIGYLGLAPAFQVAHNVNHRWEMVARRAAPLLGSWPLRDAIQLQKFEPELTSHDPEVVHFAATSPHIIRVPLTLGWGLGIHGCGQMAYHILPTMDIRVRICCGGEDTIARPPELSMLPTQGHLEIIEGLRHNLIAGQSPEARAMRERMIAFGIECLDARNHKPIPASLPEIQTPPFSILAGLRKLLGSRPTALPATS